MGLGVDGCVLFYGLEQVIDVWAISRLESMEIGGEICKLNFSKSTFAAQHVGILQ